MFLFHISGKAGARFVAVLSAICFFSLPGAQLRAREFVHPGGLHTQADLDRMKQKVEQGEHPWVEGWEALQTDPWAQHTFEPRPMENMGVSRQRASVDAHAVYLNAIRWYVSGDEAYARCAIDICNAWSSAVNQVPRARQDQGLLGIPIGEFAMAAEVLRVCPLWEAADFERFKDMMVNYLYPVSRDFLRYHDGTNMDYCWTNWDACNMVALVAIGILCDREDIYDEGIHYYKYGAGNGAIANAVPFLHRMDDGTVIGQWQESGRDQAHAQLGVGLLGNVCQMAWNQGDDLFGYDDNRLLAGAEYVARHNQMRGVPFTFYNNSHGMNNRWPAINAQGAFGERPVWEMIYNHYEVLRGIPAPYSRRMAELLRPEHGGKDHFGYGTLTFTLQPSSYPPLSLPAVPQGLVAEASVGKVFVSWQPSGGFRANGYVLQRSEAGKDDFADIAVYHEYMWNQYTDANVQAGVAYDYRVAAVNQTGRSAFSDVVRAVPAAEEVLPEEWSCTPTGNLRKADTLFAQGGFSPCGQGTFLLRGANSVLRQEGDSLPFICRKVEGDFTFVCRLQGRRGTVGEAGLMVRGTLDTASDALTMTLGHLGWRFARVGVWKRSENRHHYVHGNAYTWLPAWFKLVRVGDVFYVYESPDGADWHYVHAEQMPLAREVYVGLTAVFGGGEHASQAEFDHVQLR